MEFSHWPTLMFHVIPPISSDGLINLLNWYVNIGKKNRIQIDDVKLRQYETKWFKLSVVKFYTMGLAFKLSKTKTNLNWKQVFDWIVTFESLTKCNEKHRPSKVLFFYGFDSFQRGEIMPSKSEGNRPHSSEMFSSNRNDWQNHACNVH